MKKTIYALLEALIMSCSQGLAAASPAPSVKVDGRTVVFREEQSPIIQNDRLYVPVRRVLEDMGASVKWNEADRTVTVNSRDNITRLIMTIDSPEITVYTFTSVLHADKSTIRSDVPPIIVNDRTMLPIRAVAEALSATVRWDEAAALTSITTKHTKNAAAYAGAENARSEDFDAAEYAKPSVPKLSLDCSAENVKPGDKVTLELKLADIEAFAEDARLTATTLGIIYDKENFRFDGYQCYNGEDIASDLGTSNPDFYENCVKLITLNLPQNAYLPGEDGVILHVSFTAVGENGGRFAISDGKTGLGYDTELLFVTGEDEMTSVSEFDELYIDTTPVYVK